LKIKLGAHTLLMSIALITLTGCRMTDSNDSDEIPSSGTRSIEDASADTKKISSEIIDLIAIKGKTSEPGPGVSQCGDDKAREKFYRMRHPWSFTPASGEQLGDVMERLKEGLSKQGWKVVEYERDSSRNKNLNLTADNDEKKFGVNIVHLAKNDPPMLSVTVVSGCYQVPEGERVDRF
jgi:hypothetical protein